MLEAMRKHAQGWVSGLIVGLLTLAFALWGLEYYIGSHAGADVVAKVNGKAITNHQVNRLYGQMRQNLTQQLGGAIPIDERMQQLLKRRALDQLVTSTILQQDAMEAGFLVAPSQVAEEIRGAQIFQENGQFSPNRFNQFLRTQGFSQDEFLRFYADSMMSGQLRTGILWTSLSMPHEVDSAVKLAEQKRSFKTLDIPLKTFLPSITIREADAKKYYDLHKDQFQDAQKVRIDYIELSGETIGQNIKPTDAQLQQFYNEHVASFSAPKQWQVDRWHIELPKEAKHEQVVAAKTQLEQVKQGKEGHGIFNVVKNTAWLTQNAEPNTADLIARLASLKVGQYTDVFATDTGVELVKYVAFKDATHKAYKDVAAEVKTQFLRRQVEKQFAELSDKLSEAVYTNPDSLSAAAEQLGLIVQTSDYFSRAGAKDGIASNPEVVKEAFSPEVLNDSNNSNVIELKPGHIAVLRVKEVVPPKPKAFAQVRAEIETILKQQQADEQVNQLGENILSQLQKNQSVDALLKQHNLKWEAKVDASRREQGVKPDVLRLAFSMPDPAVTKKAAYRSQSMTDGSYVIVQLDKVTDAKPKDMDAKQQTVFADRIANGFGALEFDLYMKSLKDHASVSITPNLGY